MNIFFYTMLFLIGCIIGGVWAVKSCKIPRSLDMKKIHNTNHHNADTISILTYILIGGTTSVILANVLNINMGEIDIIKTIIYVFAMIYISALVLIAGIDRNYLRIEKNVLAFGIISSLIYMVYLCAVDLASIYLNLIYLCVYMIFLVIDSFLLRRYAKDSYIIDTLLLLTMILSYTDLRILTYTISMSFIAVVLYTLLLKIQQKKRGNEKVKISEIPVGFFIAASNIIVLYMVKIFENYCI